MSRLSPDAADATCSNVLNQTNREDGFFAWYLYFLSIFSWQRHTCLLQSLETAVHVLQININLAFAIAKDWFSYLHFNWESWTGNVLRSLSDNSNIWFYQDAQTIASRQSIEARFHIALKAVEMLNLKSILGHLLIMFF